MKHSMLNRLSFLAILFVGMIFLIACSKEKVPVFEPTKPTKWELIEGDYLVFDTLGNELYEMSLDYTRINKPDGYYMDSLYFKNFDGQFNFGSYQDLSNIMPPYTIELNSLLELVDTSGARLKMQFLWNIPKANEFSNDTIYLYFSKNNINYYLIDLVPYFNTVTRQIAVKQH